MLIQLMAINCPIKIEILRDYQMRYRYTNAKKRETVNGLVVVGVGSMGWNHARVCSELGVLVGVCDRDEEAVSKVSEHFGVPGFSDLSVAISETKPSGVIIATPTSTHAGIASDVINRGINVLVEKPIASDVSEAEGLVTLAKESGVTLAVGHIERHNPVISAAKRELSKGVLGEVVTISTRRVSNFPGRIRDVGVILDLGIHDIDNVTYLMEDKPTKVYATGGSLNDIEHEDNATLIVDFENGNSAVIETNWITPMKVRKVSLTCENAFAELDYIKQEMLVSKSNFIDSESRSQYDPKIEVGIKNVPVIRAEPLKLEIQDFLDSIKHGRAPLVDGEQGVLALRIATAALESLKSGKVIELG